MAPIRRDQYTFIVPSDCDEPSTPKRFLCHTCNIYGLYFSSGFLNVLRNLGRKYAFKSLPKKNIPMSKSC